MVKVQHINDRRRDSYLSPHHDLRSQLHVRAEFLLSARLGRKLSIKVIDWIDPLAAHIRALDKLVGKHAISVHKATPLPRLRHPLIHLHDLEPVLLKRPRQLRDPLGRLLRPRQALYHLHSFRRRSIMTAGPGPRRLKLVLLQTAAGLEELVAKI